MRRKNSVSRLRIASLRLGKKGEDLACRLLKNLGMEVIYRNYSGPRGEIDVIVRDGLILCFVEVKARRHSTKSRPADAITSMQKQRIIRTARHYLQQLGNPAIPYRFDVVELIFNGRKLFEARYWPNEFLH